MEPKTEAAVRGAPAAWEREAVPAEVYAEVARSLASAESPVGIDAKHTHVLILHALDRIEQRLRSGAGEQTADATEGAEPTRREAEVRRQVRALLERSPAFAKLGEGEQRRLDEALAGATNSAASGLTAAVDFPGFVADLLGGVFDAMVNASVEQMKAYTRLLEEAASAAGEFVEEASSRRLAAQRRQLLATMSLMGISRVKVGRRGVRARTVFGAKDEDDDD